MRIAAPIHQGRISPVLDVARRFLVLDMQEGRETTRHEILFDDTEFLARNVARLNCNVLVCGAVSRPLHRLLMASGVKVVHNARGPVDDVLKAYLEGRLDSPAFVMPGCGCQGRGRRRRRRGSWGIPE